MGPAPAPFGNHPLDGVSRIRPARFPATRKATGSGIKAHGALAIAQIMHAGAISQGNRFRDTTVGPSAVQPKGEQMTFYNGKGRYAVPGAMTEAQIDDAITALASRQGAPSRLPGLTQSKSMAPMDIFSTSF